MRRVILCLMVLWVSAGTLQGAAPVKFSDQAVEAAIAKGIKYLFSKQKGDGSWQHFAGHVQVQTSGPTGLCVYALLDSGVSVQDPRIVKALAWLQKHRTPMTYSAACQANAWLAANRQSNGKYRRELYADARLLVGTSTSGRHHYKAEAGVARTKYDNSNTQFGLLGAWAAVQDNVEVPRQYFMYAMKHWEGDQNADGGWGYRKGGKGGHGSGSRGTMTAGGVASLFVCFDMLYADKFITCGRKMDYKPIQRGLAWFDKNFAKSVSNVTRQNQGYYYLYGIERVGLAAGYKYFGTQDWYKIGAMKLIADQRSNGSWLNTASGNVNQPAPKPKPKAPAKKAMVDGNPDDWTVLAAPKKNAKPKHAQSRPMDIINTCFALLFLIRGRHPVLFNKLEFEGDWNNRPRDLASLTLWISQTFERTVNWQIVNLKVPVKELHDAPILYISGSKEFTFSKAAKDKLRTFVWQGGTLFSVTECNGKPFEQGIRKLYAELFPKYEMVPVDKTHALYGAHFPLKGTPRFSVVSNGVRPLAIHTTEDLSKAWQLKNRTTQRIYFEAAANLFLYTTDYGSLRHRGTSNWPNPKPTPVKKQLTIARIRHNGNCDPEPLAYDRFKLMMKNEEGVALKVTPPQPASALAGSDAKIAVLTGTNAFTLPVKDKRAIKAFVNGGGTLVIDAAGGPRYKHDAATQVNRRSGFTVAAEEMIEDVFGEGSLRRMSASAPLFSAGGRKISSVRYRRETRKRLAGMKDANLRAVLIGNRPGVIYSQEDITGGLVGFDCSTVDGYTPDSAYQVMRNIVLAAGGVKAGATKPPAKKPPTKKPPTKKPPEKKPRKPKK